MTPNRDSRTTKISPTRDGRHRGGISWGNGSLTHLLNNRVYIGETRHRDEHFLGEHSAIIAVETWDRVQAQLASRRSTRLSATNLDHRNLLQGLLYDGLGRRMQGSQANRGTKRYHYYTTNPADARITPGQSWRLPAADLEATVVQRLTAFLGSSASLYEAATDARLPDHALSEFIARANLAAGAIKVDPVASLELLRRVDVQDDRLELTLCIDTLLPVPTTGTLPAQHRLSVPMARIKRGKEVRMIIGTGAPMPALADPALIKLLATARAAWRAMLASSDAPLVEVAKSQGYLPEHFTLLLRLSTLAPCIVTAIVEGRQPVTLRASGLRQSRTCRKTGPGSAQRSGSSNSGRERARQSQVASRQPSRHNNIASADWLLAWSRTQVYLLSTAPLKSSLDRASDATS